MKNINFTPLIDLNDQNHALRLSHILNHLMAKFQIDGVQLSKKTGIPATTVNRLRKGEKTTNPTLTTLIPLADFFSVSVSQLIGDEPLDPHHLKDLTNIHNHSLHHIPLISWENAIDWPQSITESHISISTEYVYGNDAYALTVNENDWENLIYGTIIIIDPSITPKHRDYIIIHRQGQPTPTLKQILYDEGQTYLKPVIQGYNITSMTKEHKILGVVTELRKNLRI